MRKIKPIHSVFESKFDKDRDWRGCWIWKGSVNEWGKPIFLYNRSILSAPKFSYRFYIDPIPEGLYAIPRCKNNLCVNPNHLVLMTKSQIAKRSVKRKDRPHLRLQKPPRLIGQKNGNSKYSDEFALQIKQERAKGVKIWVLAVRYGIPWGTVSFLARRRLGVANEESNAPEMVPESSRTGHV